MIRSQSLDIGNNSKVIFINNNQLPPVIGSEIDKVFKKDTNVSNENTFLDQN